MKRESIYLVEGEFIMSSIAIVGINWGDDGKDRMVNLLTEDYDVVVRYQGGRQCRPCISDDVQNRLKAS